MFDVLSKLKKNRIWSIGLFVQNEDFSPNTTLRSPEFILDSRKLRISKNHVHTYADPFLFPYEDELYLFFESQAVSQPGKIEAVKTRDLKTFEYLGEILKAPFHLSYPFVFRTTSSVFLIPESLAANEVALYEFARFPFQPFKARVLLVGSYRDSCLIYHDDYWFLFTTSETGLEIFSTDDVETGDLQPHPCNPITTDSKYSRGGGGIITIDGSMHRISQDCSGEYGRNVSIIRINELSQTKYDEEVVVDDYFGFHESWNSLGGHHINVAAFRGKTVVAVDGRQNDRMINKFMGLIFR
jgi:hypothetical protein